MRSCRWCLPLLVPVVGLLTADCAGNIQEGCVPGQSIACTGAGGCTSSQVCNADGKGYGACECPAGGSPDAGSSLDSGSPVADAGIDAGVLPDGYAPLPAPVGTQGYNAIWASVPPGTLPGAPGTRAIFLPLYSAPDCRVVPPYGDCYAVAFEPGSVGPSGMFPACSQTSNPVPPCYEPEVFVTPGVGNWEEVAGGMYTLSAFDVNGIAHGQMDTAEGIVPLVVKNCP